MNKRRDLQSTQQIACITKGEEKATKKAPPGPITCFRGHNDAVNTVSFLSQELDECSPLLASGSADGKAIIWDLRSRSATETFVAHDASVLSLSPLNYHEPRMIVTLGRDGLLKLWDIENIYKTRRECEDNSARFAGPISTMVTGSRQFCNASTLYADVNHVGGNSSMFDKVIATPSEIDGEILLWDIRSREIIRSISSEVIGMKVSNTNSRGMVTCIKLCSKILSGAIIPSLYQKSETKVASEALPTKGKSLLSQQLQESNVISSSLSSSTSQCNPSTSDVNACIYAGYENGSLSGIDLRTFKHFLYFQPHNDPLMTLDVAPDSKCVITAGADQTIQRWTINEDEAKRTEMMTQNNFCALKDMVNIPESGTSCVKYRCDGRIIVSGHWDHTIRVFDAKRLKPIAVLRHHRDSVFAIDFTRPTTHQQGAGGIFATGSKDGTVAVWDIFAETLRLPRKEITGDAIEDEPT